MQILLILCHKFAKLNALNDPSIHPCDIRYGPVTITDNQFTCKDSNDQDLTIINTDDIYIHSSTPNNAANLIKVNVKPDREIFIYLQSVKIDLGTYPIIDVLSGIAHIIFSGNCTLFGRSAFSTIQCSSKNSTIIFQENEHYSGTNNLTVVLKTNKPRSAVIGTSYDTPACNEIRFLSGNITALMLSDSTDSYAATIGTGTGSQNPAYIKSIVFEGGNVTSLINVSNVKNNLRTFYPRGTAIGAGYGEGKDSAFVKEILFKGGRVYAEAGYVGTTIGAGSGGSIKNSSFVQNIIFSGTEVVAPSVFFHKGHYGASVGGGYGGTADTAYVSNIIVKGGSISSYYIEPPNHKDQYSYASVFGGGTGVNSNTGYVTNIEIYDGILNLNTSYDSNGTALGGSRGGETNYGQVKDNAGYVENLMISGGKLRLFGSNFSAALGGGYHPNKTEKCKRSGSITNLRIRNSEIPLYIHAETHGIPAVSNGGTYLVKNFERRDEFLCRGENNSICDFVNEPQLTLTFTGHYHLFNPYRNPIFIMVIAAGFYTSFFYS